MVAFGSRRHRLLLSFMLTLIGAGPPAHAQEPAWVAFQRWLQAADVAANEAVTFEICGWGTIDLRTPFLAQAVRQGLEPAGWEALAARFDEAVRERRRVEAALTAHGGHAPPQRLHGLHPTGGCPETLRRRIAERGAVPQAPGGGE